MLHQVDDVARCPGQEVVEAHHLDAAVEQVLAQVRPQETGAAGDHRAPDGACLPDRAGRLGHRALPSRADDRSRRPPRSYPAYPPTHFGAEVLRQAPPTPTGPPPPRGDPPPPRGGGG